VLTRLLTETRTGRGRYDVHLDLNFVSWPPQVVQALIKALFLLLVGLLALFCRTETRRRDDQRLLGEFSLVVLTMLFLSERSWKHHYVTLLLPYTYLMAQFAFATVRLRTRVILAAAMWSSVGLMATTSTEIGGLLAHGQGHKMAQGYGMFLWAGVLLYVVTAWRVRVERHPPALVDPAAAREVAGQVIPTPHFEDRARRMTRP
jgi:hypothetical protein